MIIAFEIAGKIQLFRYCPTWWRAGVANKLLIPCFIHYFLQHREIHLIYRKFNKLYGHEHQQKQTNKQTYHCFVPTCLRRGFNSAYISAINLSKLWCTKSKYSNYNVTIDYYFKVFAVLKEEYAFVFPTFLQTTSISWQAKVWTVFMTLCFLSMEIGSLM